jgi:hypothetical protein
MTSSSTLQYGTVPGSSLLTQVGQVVVGGGDHKDDWAGVVLAGGGGEEVPHLPLHHAAAAHRVQVSRTLLSLHLKI